MFLDNSSVQFIFKPCKQILPWNKFLSASLSLEKFWLHYQWRKKTPQAQHIFYISNPTETPKRINVKYVWSLVQNLLCFWQGKYINVCN